MGGLAQLKLSAESQATFFVDLNGRTEKAVIMGEVYRYQVATEAQGAWAGI